MNAQTAVAYALETAVEAVSLLWQTQQLLASSTGGDPFQGRYGGVNARPELPECGYLRLER